MPLYGNMHLSKLFVTNHMCNSGMRPEMVAQFFRFQTSMKNLISVF